MKKTNYIAPETLVVELETKENILEGSNLGTGDRNDIGFSDDEFDGTFRSNSNIWDL